MNTYEFITPSDPITFKAADDKVAFACTVLLGRGNAGCDNKTTGKSLPTLLLFATASEFAAAIQDFLGTTLEVFCAVHKPQLAECFRSFAYGSESARRDFDAACEAITDPEKLKQFRAKHEDNNRSSLSRWVQIAWECADELSADAHD